MIFPHLPGKGLEIFLSDVHPVLLLLLLVLRFSTASCTQQWALPNLNRELQISVGTAGPQLRAPDFNGHCQISTASCRFQWALPDLSQTPERISE